MKLYLLLASLLTTSMAYVAVRSPPCREDEVHLECASACHPTCDTYDEPVDVCTTQAVNVYLWRSVKGELPLLCLGIRSIRDP
ncbi:hypothetical protein BJX61DRAFT_546483 [Aspergillus egyptiacus]|nr:hypothetical protein BJX61DRAFT_546483 [Aspergillus egyptiacus]